jgi:hypothetical protein
MRKAMVTSKQVSHFVISFLTVYRCLQVVIYCSEYTNVSLKWLDLRLAKKKDAALEVVML